MSSKQYLGIIMSAFQTSLLSIGLLTLPVLATTTLSPLSPYANTDPLPEGFVAGLDFNDSSPTAAGYLGVGASNNKSYNLTHNGVNFDITVSNANLGNQNRYRGAGNLANNGALLADFEQWYGNTGTPVEVTFELTGLNPVSEYRLGFFHVNIGCCQTTQTYFDGDSSAAPLIGTNQSGGNFRTPSTWEPGTEITKWSDRDGKLTITAIAEDGGQRFTLAGLYVAVPEPSSAALLGLAGGLALLRRRR
ncbi:MAG: PEP-CTERM sorting domain-containing protein [Akkermansiaceae bacterium]